MGRREKPVDPGAGPIQRLAHDLRLLREKAGKPPYREMAERAGYSTTALSQAAAGDQLPSLALVRAYVQALDADPDDWERRWREADAEVRAPSAEERAPYLGLARFDPGDSDLFFGRTSRSASCWTWSARTGSRSCPARPARPAAASPPCCGRD